jgi:hypothetical protein
MDSAPCIIHMESSALSISIDTRLTLAYRLRDSIALKIYVSAGTLGSIIEKYDEVFHFR